MEAMEYYYDDDQEKFLSLSLAIVGDYNSGNISVDHHRIKRKRVIRRSLRETNLMIKPPTNSTSNISQNSFEVNKLEGKVLRLLQMREQMLKQDKTLTNIDHHHHHDQYQQNPTGLHLIHLLLEAAAALETDVGPALESLSELYAAGASTKGDAVQRVAAHFADALAARLLRRRKSLFCHVIDEPPTAAEELSAFLEFYKASPVFQFAHFTANQAIIEAFERDGRAVHVIDFDVSHGLQWPSLIQSLTDKASGGPRISVRITGLGTDPDRLQATANRLVSFSEPFRNRLEFEFQGLVINKNDKNFARDLIVKLSEKKRSNETLAVNFMFPSSVESETLLRLVRESLSPSVLVLVEREGPSTCNINYGKSSRSGLFLATFMESLHYFAAMFDSLDDGLPRGSAERLGVEKNYLGREIIKAMLVDDDDECGVVGERWRERMASHGFGRVRVSSKNLIQAKLLLKMRAHQYCCFPQYYNGGEGDHGDGDSDGDGGGGFRVFERDEGMAISLGWQNRCLITASVWQCVNL